ncbi:hypothetical protein HUU05_26525 [candidate division KSB1 bacterium]|nr:hypothetical protein [candidate division KSB1 bacterium]
MKTNMDAMSLRSLTLIHEFEQYIIEHPRFAEKIPYGAQVVLLPVYDKELREYNLRNAQINAEPERPVVHVEITALRPRRSLIVSPRMKIPKKLSANGKKSQRKKAKLYA